MRVETLALAASGVAAALALVPAQARQVPGVVPQVSDPSIQPVWYDRWGRWHPPAYYGPVRPGYYPYGPPRYYYPYGYAPPRYYRPPPYPLYGLPPPY